MPAATMRSRTSPALGRSSSISSMLSGRCKARITAALVCTSASCFRNVDLCHHDAAQRPAVDEVVHRYLRSRHEQGPAVAAAERTGDGREPGEGDPSNDVALSVNTAEVFAQCHPQP